MWRYTLRRLVLMVPTLIGVSMLVTALMRLLPGDAIDIMVADGVGGGASAKFAELVDSDLRQRGVDPSHASFAEKKASEQTIVDAELRDEGKNPDIVTDSERFAARNSIAVDAYKGAIRARLGLDKGYLDQWSSWIWNAAHGDFGTSLLSDQPVGSELRSSAVVSLELGIFAMVVSILVALPVGVISAVKRDTWMDYAARTLSISALALPSFFVATLVIAIGARYFSYSFPLFYKDLWVDPKQNLQLILAPAVILGFALSGPLMRLTRAQMLDVLLQDYMRTAYAKGLSRGTVIRNHAMRNALIPVVTIVGLQVPALVGGALVLEQIFGIPGIGRYLFASISNRDFPAIMAINMLAALAIMLTNLLVDVTYAYLDPRVKVA